MLGDTRVPKDLAVNGVDQYGQSISRRRGTHSSDFFTSTSGGSYDADWRNDQGKYDVCESGVDPE